MSDIDSSTNAILVIGGGELGMAMLRGFAGRGSAQRGTLSVLLRSENTETLKRSPAVLRELGVSVVCADLATASQEALAAIFANYSTVICCTGFVGGPGTQRKITGAVLSAGVDRYVPWQFGVDYDVVGRGSGQEVFDEQSDVRDMLRSQSRTQWIVISTGMFTSFLFEPSFGVVDLENGEVHALGSWDYRLTVTTPDDIGRLTVAILAHQPYIINEVVYVAGDTFSYAQLADMVEFHLGQPVKRILWDLETLRLEAAANPDDGMRKYHLAFARETGVAWDKGDTFNARQTIAVTDVPSWLANPQHNAK